MRRSALNVVKALFVLIFSRQLKQTEMVIKQKREVHFRLVLLVLISGLLILKNISSSLILKLGNTKWFLVSNAYGV